MLIQLYENVINEDGSRTPGRIVGEIRCKGDGTPGEFIFFDTCNEIWDIRDANFYGNRILINDIIFNDEDGNDNDISESLTSDNDKIVILDDMDKEMLKSNFEYPLNITVDGGEVDGVEFSVPATLQPWYRETIEYLLEYKVNGSVCGKIIED
jgi:hypothetical protein